jgi:hypothetical protein
LVEAAVQNRFRYLGLGGTLRTITPYGFSIFRVFRVGTLSVEYLPNVYHSAQNYHTRSVCGAKPKASATSSKSASQLQSLQAGQVDEKTPKP